MTASTDQLFGEICSRYGGVDRMSLSHASVARALATELARDALDTRAIVDLELLLPQQSTGPRSLDLTKLTDEQLDQLEAMADAGAIPEMSADEDTAALEKQIVASGEVALKAIAGKKHEADLREVAEQSEQTYKRLLNSALARVSELEEQLHAAREAVVHKPDVDPSPLDEAPASRPSNVVPLLGDGSCKINMSLDERYEHLRGTPPVGKW